MWKPHADRISTPMTVGAISADLTARGHDPTLVQLGQRFALYVSSSGPLSSRVLLLLRT